MESPVVVDKPPVYHGKGNNDRGFPFDDEEGSGAWSELASRHPDIAARLRQRPSTWARKRRPTSQDGDDFGDHGFSGFDRFPFDDIPPEFRGHFPSHWNRRFSSQEQPPSSPPAQSHSPQPQHTSAATQTELHPDIDQSEIHTSLPQYGLRNTVDLGQKSPADPSLVDTQERSQRSVSAPPDNRTANQSHTPNMSAPNHKEGHLPQQEPSNVRHIPIFVEGRDEPVINRTVDHGTHFGETKPAYTPPPQQPHVDRDQYFADDVPAGFHHAPNFPRTFGTPFNKSYRQNTQPFVQQKVYPQNAFARGTSPQRSQSPKPQMHPEEHYVKVPVHHEQTAPPTRPQQKQPPQQHQKPAPQPQPQKPAPHQPHQPPPQQQEAPPQPKPQQPNANDPITQILSIQTDVLNLMTDVENFTGSKKDKRYMYLDEMLTRNLIKLDTIETEGKENIRQARKEAIRCIQKCIAVLEAKAEKGNSTPQPQDVEMEITESASPQVEQTEGKENSEVEMKEAKENGEVEMKDIPKETVAETNSEESAVPPQENAEQKTVEETKILAETQATDIRPEGNKPEATSNQDENEKPVLSTETNADNKPSPKKVTKVAKKRDKSKDKKAGNETSNKKESVECKDDKEQAMEVDGAAASQ